jgi:hypothetical protein
MLLLVVAMLLMGSAPLLCFAFHAVRGMYLHAERLLAKAGGKAQGEGDLPSGAKRRTSEAKVCTSVSAEDCGKPLVLRQGRALSQGLVSLFVRVSAPDF